MGAFAVKLMVIDFCFVTVYKHLNTYTYTLYVIYVFMFINVYLQNNGSGFTALFHQTVPARNTVNGP